jgi:DNA-binding NtrC family response regulator
MSGGETKEHRLCLVVISDDAVATHAIPDAGRLAIGRSEESDIVVDDPEISREHAVLHVGDPITIEDLGSANGTFVRGERITPHQRIPIETGQVIDVGTTMLLVQPRRREVKRSRTLETHAVLELELRAACERSRGGGRATFTLMRVSIDPSAGTEGVREALTSAVRSSDIIASYAPGEYEILLLETSRSRVDRLATEVSSRLAAADVSARIGVATFPGDGNTPDALISAVSVDLHGSKGAKRPELVVVDQAMKDLFRMIDRIAHGTISVLLLGETGAGKEVIAEQIHERSPRSTRPFVRFNCAALSETVLESELFGHEKGAFTGADQAKVGLLESADGGSVFLDEIGDLSQGMQAKLLRALEQREILPVGGVRPRPIDVRFISATNRDLELDVEGGHFRQDLYYRLNGVTVRIPPLRERPSEIEPLADLFVERSSEAIGLEEPPVLTDRTVELLTAYAWPGNIRELRNVIERAVLLSDSHEILPEHLPLDKLAATWAARRPVSRPAAGEREKRVLEALDACAGNQTRAAEVLGISRRTLTKWLDRFDLPRPRKPRRPEG